MRANGNFIMIQEIFNSLKKLMDLHKNESHEELRNHFEEQFTKDATTLVELLIMSPELNGEGKKDPENYFKGVNYNLPIAIYIFRRTAGEENALEEPASYQDHLDKNYAILVEKTIEIHQKNDETLQVEDIRIPSQDFIENLTHNCLLEIQKLDINNTTEPEYNTSEMS